MARAAATSKPAKIFVFILLTEGSAFVPTNAHWIKTLYHSILSIELGVEAGTKFRMFKDSSEIGMKSRLWQSVRPDEALKASEPLRCPSNVGLTWMFPNPASRSISDISFPEYCSPSVHPSMIMLKAAMGNGLVVRHNGVFCESAECWYITTPFRAFSYVTLINEFLALTEQRGRRSGPTAL